MCVDVKGPKQESLVLHMRSTLLLGSKFFGSFCGLLGKEEGQLSPQPQTCPLRSKPLPPIFLT